jgi:hypothetical protein
MYEDAKKMFEENIKAEVTEIRYLDTMKKYKLIDDRRVRERLNRRRDNRGEESEWRRRDNNNEDRGRFRRNGNERRGDQ